MLVTGGRLNYNIRKYSIDSNECEESHHAVYHGKEL